MRAVVRTTIIRDKAGYEVRDHGNPAPAKRATILGGPPSGVHIIGKAGINELITISNEKNLRLWQKACRLSCAQDVAHFMCRWGQITRGIVDDGSQPYEEAFILIEPHLRGLKVLAEFVDAGDKFGFVQHLKNQVLLSRANIAVDISIPDLPLVIEAPSLLRFMLLEMWSEFGGERPAGLGIRNCPYCSKPFHVGGRQGTATRRADARYCSDSCKNMASRARSSAHAIGTATRRLLET